MQLHTQRQLGNKLRGPRYRASPLGVCVAWDDVRNPESRIRRCLAWRIAIRSDGITLRDWRLGISPRCRAVAWSNLGLPQVENDGSGEAGGGVSVGVYFIRGGGRTRPCCRGMPALMYIRCKERGWPPLVLAPGPRLPTMNRLLRHSRCTPPDASERVYMAVCIFYFCCCWLGSFREKGSPTSHCW